MNSSIEKYLDDLKVALKGLDRSTVQDALSNSEDHLNSALMAELETNPEANVKETVARVIDLYGTPEEISDVYTDIEEHTTPVFALSEDRGWTGFKGFLAIAGEPKAWAACLYMILSLITGVFYFTWAVTGLSVSVSLIVIILGIPICLLFLMSVRGIGFVEGRLVEALLGTRMPRRSIMPESGSWWDKFKTMLKTSSTWKTLVYMILQMPLGIVYFTLIVTLFSLGLGFVGAPFVQYGLNEPFIHNTWVPFYAMPLVMIIGGLILILTLHLAKQVGRMHGKFAKVMLVS